MKNIYQIQIDNNSVILDLMNSWCSHLPQGIKYKKVIGHGLNEIELNRNKGLGQAFEY